MGLHQAVRNLTSGGCLQLLPLMWLGLMTLSFTVVVLLKWALMQRLRPGAFAKYTWAFQTRAVSVGIQVCTRAADASYGCLPHPQRRKGLLRHFFTNRAFNEQKWAKTVPPASLSCGNLGPPWLSFDISLCARAGHFHAFPSDCHHH